MPRRDDEPKLNQLTPDQLALLAKRNLTPDGLKDAFRIIGDQFRISNPQLSQPVKPTKTRVPLRFPLERVQREDSNEAPSFSNRFAESRAPRENITPLPVIKRPTNRGISRRWFLVGGVAAIATKIVAGPIADALEQALQRAVDGFNNPPGLEASKTARTNALSSEALRVYSKQERDAAAQESAKIKEAINKGAIETQIKYLEDFARGIDKSHSNPHAGDIHREQAEKLREQLKASQ